MHCIDTGSFIGATGLIGRVLLLENSQLLTLVSLICINSLTLTELYSELLKSKKRYVYLIQFAKKIKVLIAFQCINIIGKTVCIDCMFI